MCAHTRGRTALRGASVWGSVRAIQPTLQVLVLQQLLIPGTQVSALCLSLAVARGGFLQPEGLRERRRASASQRGTGCGEGVPAVGKAGGGPGGAVGFFRRNTIKVGCTV